MPINATLEYGKAEQVYLEARTPEEKLVALQDMLSKAPSHKGSEVLRMEIKTKISKLKELLAKQKAKKGGRSVIIKKEGAALITLVGTTNSGKSTLLKELTNANIKIADYEYTTKKPEVGTMDYHGVKLQIIEVPSVFENFIKSEKGPTYFSLINNADLIVLMFNTPKEKDLLERELSTIGIKKIVLIKGKNIKDRIWKNLGLIKVYTKQPGKEKDYPPVALDKGSTIRALAGHVHKDFIKQFTFARIWGKSAKFKGQQTGLDHKLKDDDVVELHLK